MATASPEMTSGAGPAGRGEGDDGVHAGEELAVAVIDLDLGEQGAGVLVDGGGGAGDVAVEARCGELLEVNGGVLAGVDGGGVALGDGDEDAQAVDLGDGEEGAALAAASR